MPTVTVWWNQKPLDRAVERWKKTGLTAAAKHLEKAIETSIAIAGYPTYRRSYPGEAPRYESKDLIKSWTYTVNAPVGYALVYSSLDYSYYLEVGARTTYGFLQPRPYIRRALMAEEPVLLALMTQPLP